MPNHVRNNVTIIGSVIEVAKFWQMFGASKAVSVEDRLTRTQRIQTSNEEVDPTYFEMDFSFDKIIAQPEELKINYDGLVMFLDGYCRCLLQQQIELQQQIMASSKLVLESLNTKTIYDFVRATCPSDKAQIIIQDLDRADDDGRENFCKAIRNYRKYGYATWYDWSCENWGTKWDAYGQSRKSENEFSFKTAWAHPFPVMCEMSKMFRSLVFEIKYADEDIGSNVGHYRIVGGITTYLRSDTEITEESKKFACDV
jgi:hypothetical protein